MGSFRRLAWRCVLLGVAALCCSGAGAQEGRRAMNETRVVKQSNIEAPRVAAACRRGACPFAGQSLTLIVSGDRMAAGMREVRREFVEATGAQLQIVEVSFDEHFANLISDMTNRVGKYDVSIAGAWWLGELVAGDYIISYDHLYGDPRFPKWSIDDVLPAPRSLLLYGGRKYMVANDHDGQIMYYRRDLLAAAGHQAAFQARYGRALQVPATWDEFREVAEYFNGQDLNGDGEPDHGVVMPLRAGAQGMFHFMSLSAPFVIGPANPRHYWFDPRTMKPLIDSPGHVKALQTLVALVKFGPKDMLTWDLGRGWDHFLAGRAALAMTWGDLGALAQQEGSKVRGRLGAAPLPGTREYYAVPHKRWMRGNAVNRVGNTTGGSWAGVISRFSKAPEAAYYLLALLATKPKSVLFAARGWDGIDPGRRYHFLPPEGTGELHSYLDAGWDEADVRAYLHAYSQTFSNPLQFPYLRIPGTFSYWQALDLHLAEAAAGQLSPEAALKAAAVDFEEITVRLGRERQKKAYRSSLGLK